MATRYYLTTKSHGALLPGPLKGAWDADQASGSNPRLHSLVQWTFLLDTSKVRGGRRTNLTVGEVNDTANWDQEICRWATNPLEA